MQEHFIFEHDIKQYNFLNQNQIKAKSSSQSQSNLQQDDSGVSENNLNNIINNSNGNSENKNENHSETWDHHTITNLELVSDKDKEIMRGLYQVKSGQRPILNPAELADMEAFLGSKPG